MNWPIPWHRIEIASPLPPAEVERRLATITQRQFGWIVRPKPPIQFVGRIANGLFRVLPVEQGQNTYTAWTVGRIERAEGGSRLSVLMTLHPIAVVVVAAFFLGPQLLGWFGGADSSTLWAGALVVFHIVMYYVGFRPAATRAENALRKVAGCTSYVPTAY